MNTYQYFENMKEYLPAVLTFIKAQSGKIAANKLRQFANDWIGRRKTKSGQKSAAKRFDEIVKNLLGDNDELLDLDALEAELDEILKPYLQKNKHSNLKERIKLHKEHREKSTKKYKVKASKKKFARATKKTTVKSAKKTRIKEKKKVGRRSATTHPSKSRKYSKKVSRNKASRRSQE